MSQEQTLEPCPHCGKSHTLKIVLASEHWADEYDGYYPHSESYAVMCDASSPNGPGGCGASGGFQATEADAIAVWNRRAALSATQPAQAAQGEPGQHVGDSKFESWFSEYDSKHKGTKQQMRDAYAAGMSDPVAQPAVAQGAGEVVAIEVAAKAIYEADKDMWMSGPTYADLHERDKDRCRAMARAALRCLAGTCEFAGWSGINPRTGAVEICAHTPSQSVIRDFNMRPLVFADAQPAAVAHAPLPEGWRLEDIGPQIHIHTPEGKWTAVGCETPYLALIHRFLADLLSCTQPTQPAAGADVLDAKRWRYAMDWDTKDFAVCRRVGATGTCWEPIKTDGPIDAAIAASGRHE